MKKFAAIMVSLSMLFFCSIGSAATKSAPLAITKVKAMYGGDYYLFVGNSSFCNTTAFRVNKAAPGAKNVIATAMLAISMANKVQIEAETCTGYGTLINSLFVSP